MRRIDQLHHTSSSPEPQTGRALDEDHRRLQALFEISLDAILLADDDTRFVDANPAACELLGYTRDELLRLTLFDITPAAKRSSVPEEWRRFREGGRLQGEYTLLCKDGSCRETEFRAVADVLPGRKAAPTEGSPDVSALRANDSEAVLRYGGCGS